MTAGGLGALVLALRFLTELALLVGAATAAVTLTDGWAIGLAVALVAVAVVSWIWARWVAPRAASRLADPARFVVEAALFGTVAIGLTAGGSPWSAVALAVVGVGTAALTRLPRMQH
jgi:hypothetical protein